MSSQVSGKEPIVPVTPLEQVVAPQPDAPDAAPRIEHGGRGGLEPTRYGDWEVGGICSDF